MGEVKVNADNVNELWLNNEQFLAFDFTKLFSQLNFDSNYYYSGFGLTIFNLSTEPINVYGTNIPNTTINAKTEIFIGLSAYTNNFDLSIKNLGNVLLRFIEACYYITANDVEKYNHVMDSLQPNEVFNRLYEKSLAGTFVIFNA